MDLWRRVVSDLAWRKFPRAINSTENCFALSEHRVDISIRKAVLPQATIFAVGRDQMLLFAESSGESCNKTLITSGSNCFPER
jgi:hypothetical protein